MRTQPRAKSFRTQRREAERKGWTTPGKNSRFTEEVWMRYWQQCREYEINPDAGRPVPPHTVGGKMLPGSYGDGHATHKRRGAGIGAIRPEVS